MKIPQIAIPNAPGSSPIQVRPGRTVNLNLSQVADVGDAPLLNAQPFAQAQASAGAAFQAGAQALAGVTEEIAMARFRANNTEKIAASQIRQLEAAQEFEAWKAENPDESRWSDEWKERSERLKTTLLEQEGLSPVASREIGLRVQDFSARQGVKVERDATKRTFARTKDTLVSAGELALENRDVRGFRESLSAGEDLGIWFPGERAKMERHGLRKIGADNKEQLVEGFLSQAENDPEGALAGIAELPEDGGVVAQATKYGYPDDPHIDTNSLNGIGHANNVLEAGVSVALKKSTAEKLGLESGDEVVIDFEDGKQRSFRYDDTIPETSGDNDRVDFYTPSGNLPFDGQEMRIRGLADGLDHNSRKKVRDVAERRLRELNAGEVDSILEDIAAGGIQSDQALDEALSSSPRIDARQAAEIKKVFAKDQASTEFREEALAENLAAITKLEEGDYAAWLKLKGDILSSMPAGEPRQAVLAELGKKWKGGELQEVSPSASALSAAKKDLARAWELGAMSTGTVKKGKKATPADREAALRFNEANRELDQRIRDFTRENEREPSAFEIQKITDEVTAGAVSGLDYFGPDDALFVDDLDINAILGAP